MATDPVLYAAINNLKEPIGAVRIVPSNFSSASYLDAGSLFKSSDYPDLAKVLPEATGCQGTFFTKASPNTVPFTGILAVSDDGTKIIGFTSGVFTNGQTNKMWASNDSGATWTQSNWTPTSPNTWFGIVADRNNGFVAYGNSTAATTGLLITSTSSDGITWSSITTHTAQTYPVSGFFISANNTWFASNGNNTSVKKYNGSTWTTVSGVNAGMTVPTSWNFEYFDNKIFFFSPKNGVWVSVDDGATASSVMDKGVATTSTATIKTSNSHCIMNYNSDWQYSSNGINWIPLIAAGYYNGWGTTTAPTTYAKYSINDCFLTWSTWEKTVAKSLNGIDYVFSSPIYVDSVINDYMLLAGYNNFAKDIIYITTKEGYLLRSIASKTYDEYKLLAPATSTTPGTKIVVRAK